VTASLYVSRDLTNRGRAQRALADSEERYRTLAKLAPVGIFRTDVAGNNIYNNQMSLDMLDTTAEEAALGTGWAEKLHPDDVDRVMAEWRAAMTNGTPFESEYRFVHQDGSVIWVLGRVTQEQDGSGQVVGYVGTVTDITEHKTLEEALRESEAKFRSLAETVAAAIFIVQGRAVRYLNPGIEALTGYAAQHLYDAGFAGVLHPDYRDLAPDRWQPEADQAGASTRYEAKIIRKDGEERWVDFSVRLIDYEGAPAALCAAFDITEQKRAAEALHERARRDALTGVLNHGAVVQELRTLIAGDKGKGFTVAMVDVDGMKATNDTFGHQVGDRLLITVARALEQPGVILGRYGGDEFIAILPGAGRAEAGAYHQQVKDILAGSTQYDDETGTAIPVSVSIGTALYPQDAEDVIDLIKLSDAAMYRSREGRAEGAEARIPIRRDNRASKIVGELVPFLTSDAPLPDKLRLMAHRLAIGGAYDAVAVEIFGDGVRTPTHDVYAASGDTCQALPAIASSEGGAALRALLQRTRRPVIFEDLLTDQRDPLKRQMSEGMGIQSAVTVPMVWQEEVIGIVTIGSKHRGAFGTRDAQFLKTVATQVTAMVQQATLVAELQIATDRLSQQQEQTVLMLAAAAEAHDQATGAHFHAVRDLSVALAKELGLSDAEVQQIRTAAALHDIGKVHIPDRILLNTGRLRPDDWAAMQRHTVFGQEFLRDRPGFELAALVARHHHERWDGAGYPDGLAGEEIPFAAAITGVADAFDAMTNPRSYQPLVSAHDAIRRLQEGSGTQFRPDVVAAFVHLYERGGLPVHHAREQAAA
jgi:diguanylate cyclase (GGDEF)-like protein/PAS domain S-box-containing protein